MLKYVKDLWFYKSNDLISNHDANLDAVCEFNFPIRPFYGARKEYLIPWGLLLNVGSLSLQRHPY